LFFFISSRRKAGLELKEENLGEQALRIRKIHLRRKVEQVLLITFALSKNQEKISQIPSLVLNSKD